MEPNESLLAAATAMLTAISKMRIDTYKQSNGTEYSHSGALSGRGGARVGNRSDNYAYVPRPIKSQDDHHIAVKAKTSWPLLDEGYTDIKSITKYLRNYGFRIGST